MKPSLSKLKDTQLKKTWEERFEKIDLCGCTRVCYGHDGLRKTLKSFIHSAVEEARKEGYMEGNVKYTITALNEKGDAVPIRLKKMKLTKLTKLNKIHKEGFDAGYKKARKEMEKEIKEAYKKGYHNGYYTTYRRNLINKIQLSHKKDK